jgi:uncharacterized membrane protein (UPF0127 family)
MRAALLFLVVAALCACSGASSSPGEPRSPATTVASSVAEAPREQPAVVIRAGSAEHRFRVELATTPQERARGLMFREHLDDDAGMLFLFDQMEVQSFWMKNTKIPLDMIFLDEEGVIVGIVENAEPLTLTSRSVGRPSRYVLEVNGGTSRRLGIEAGQRALFLGVPGHPAKAATGPVR